VVDKICDKKHRHSDDNQQVHNQVTIAWVIQRLFLQMSEPEGGDIIPEVVSYSLL